MTNNNKDIVLHSSLLSPNTKQRINELFGCEADHDLAENNRFGHVDTGLSSTSQQTHTALANVATTSTSNGGESHHDTKTNNATSVHNQKVPDERQEELDEVENWKTAGNKRRKIESHGTPGARNFQRVNHTEERYINYYASLEENEGMCVDNNHEVNCNNSNLETNRDKITNTNNNKKNVTPQNQTRIKFCPPILIFDANIKEINRTISKDYPNTIHRIIKTKNGSCKLFVNDHKVHSHIFNRLRNKKIASYTYTPTENKVTTLILNGIDSSYSPEEIKEEIKSILPNLEILQIKNFVTPRAKRESRNLDMFLIQIKPGQSIDELTSIKGLLYQRVKWEKIRNGEVIQCKNCQNFGHVASNCNISYRCIKCNQNHNPGECIRNSNTEESPFCVNCQSFGHPANYRGCPKYQRILENRRTRIHEAREKREERRAFVNESINNYYNKNKSFSDCLRGNTADRNLNNNEILKANNFIAMSNELFGMSLPCLIAKINQFIPEFSNIRTKAEKQAKYFEFFFNICMTNEKY